jgi:hypothetical protein
MGTNVRDHRPFGRGQTGTRSRPNREIGPWSPDAAHWMVETHTVLIT